MKEWIDNIRIKDLNNLIEAQVEVAFLKRDLKKHQLERDDMVKNKDKYIKERQEEILKNNKKYQDNKKRLADLEAERSRLDNDKKEKWK